MVCVGVGVGAGAGGVVGGAGVVGLVVGLGDAELLGCGAGAEGGAEETDGVLAGAL